MKFGIVGTNFVVDSFMNALLKIDNIEVSAVCSGHYENAVVFAKKYSIQNACNSYKEMVGMIDAVYIATPNSMHFEHAKFFLEHHIPVFLEKPMCSNYKEAKKLIEIAMKNNTYLHHGIVPLYMPNVSVLKEEIKKIGNIHNAMFVFSKYSSRFDAYLRGENPTTFRRELSNGSIMDLGVYPLSVIIYLFGKPEKVYGKASVVSTGVDAAFQSLLIYPDFSVLLMTSKASNTNIVSEISGEKGIIHIPHPSLLDIIETKQTGEERVIYQHDGDAFKYQLLDFIDSVTNHKKESNLVSHQLSLDIMETLDALRKVCNISYPADDCE